MNKHQQAMIDSLKWEENSHECYWVEDRVLVWDEIVTTDHNGRLIVQGDKCHYCGQWNEYNRVSYREADGCCCNCGAN